jgi:hypothetical protein
MNKFANLIFVFTSLSPTYAVGQVCVRHLEVPEYPSVARAAQWKGVADLTITVGSRGQVVHVEGKGSLPFLIDQAKENVKSWIFCDRQDNGSRHVYLRYDYRLEGAPVYPSPQAKVVIDFGAANVVITSPRVEPQP